MWAFAIAACTSTAWAFAQFQRTRDLARQLQAAREKAHGITEQLQRNCEDTYVLRALLVERGYVAQDDIDSARERLVDSPARQRHSLPVETRGSIH
jgi:hypothetical protein